MQSMAKVKLEWTVVVQIKTSLDIFSFCRKFWALHAAFRRQNNQFCGDNSQNVEKYELRSNLTGIASGAKVSLRISKRNDIKPVGW